MSHRFDLKQRNSPIIIMVNTQRLFNFLPKERIELLSGEFGIALGRGMGRDLQMGESAHGPCCSHESAAQLCMEWAEDI